MARFASRPALASAALAVAALVMAACSDSDSDSGDASAPSSSAAAPASSTPPAQPSGSPDQPSSGAAPSPTSTGVVLKFGLPDFPDALTDGAGRAVYTFTLDEHGNTTCDGQCAVNWPPVLTTGQPTVVGGDSGGQAGQQPRGDGTTQATYGGWPLYYFIRDTSPGAANGVGISAFGGQFLLINKNTNRVG